MAIKRGPFKWNFIFRNGELEFETPLEEDEDGRWGVAMPMQEDFDEVEKVLREKVGCDCVAEGTYAVRPGRRPKVSWRVTSPTH
jgi:hypothetical protein